MFDKLFKRKSKTVEVVPQIEECDCEKYFQDSFDKEYLYFVALGVTTMENYIKMKRMYYEKRVDKISSSGDL